MTVADYVQLMADGFGAEDISALYRLKSPKTSGSGEHSTA